MTVQHGSNVDPIDPIFVGQSASTGPGTGRPQAHSTLAAPTAPHRGVLYFCCRGAGGCRSLGLVELTATYVELEAYVRAESKAGRGSRLGELEKADRYAHRIDLSTGP